MAVLIVLLARPSAAPSWGTLWLALGLLIGVPSLASALAAHEICQRRGTVPAEATTQAREPLRWAEHGG